MRGKDPLSSLSAFIGEFSAFQPLPAASSDKRLRTLVSVLIDMSNLLRDQKAPSLELEIAREESRILALKLLTQLLADARSPQPYGAVWMSLAHTLLERHEGSLRENADEALEAFSRAADAFSTDSEEHVRALIGKGYAHLQRSTKDASDEAYRVFKDALGRVEAGSHDQSSALVGLGEAARERAFGGISAHQEEALSAYSTAIRQLDEGSLDWVTAVLGMANVLQDRVEGDPATNQEDAISAYDAAIRAAPAEGRTTGRAVLGLAQVLQSRIRGEPSDNQERALKLLKGALSSQVEQGVGWARVQGALGHLLQDRIVGDRQQNQEDALNAYFAAIKVLPVGSSDWIKSKIGVGHVLQERLSGDEQKNEQDALAAYEDALGYVEDKSAVWAKIQNGIANTLQNTRFGDTEQNQEKARVAFEGARSVFKSGSLEYARVSASLGNFYQDRLHGNPTENHRTSIAHYKKALSILEEGSLDWANVQLGLGNALAFGDLDGNGSDHRAAIDAYSSAATVFDQVSRDGVYLRDCIAYEHFQLQEPHLALDHYSTLAEVFQSAALIGLTPEAQNDILGWAPSAARYALAAGAQSGDSKRGLLTAIALRTTLLTAGLQLDVGSFAEAPEHVRQKAEEIQKTYRSKAQSVVSRTASDVETRDALRAELKDLRHELRHLYLRNTKNRLLLPETLDDLSGTIPPNGALLFVTSSRDHGYLYCLAKKDGTVRLNVSVVPDLKESSVETAINDGWILAHRKFVQTIATLSANALHPASVEQHDQAWENADKALRLLIDWCQTVVAPQIGSIIEDLGLSHVVLCPFGLLQYAPIHATIDNALVTYAPSPALSRRYDPPQTAPLLSILNPKIRDPSTGTLMDDPALLLSNGHSIGDIERDALREIVGVDAHFLEGVQARTSTLRARIQSLSGRPFDLLFSTHGRANPRYAYQSALMMTPEDGHSDSLNAAQIADLPLEDVSSVFMIACESGMITGALPEESRSLVTAFLEAGAKSVVSALWSVPVMSASTLLLEVQRRRYQARCSTAVALRDAVVAARDGTLAPVASTSGLKGGALRAGTKLTLAHLPHVPSTATRITEDWLLKSPLTWAAWIQTGAWDASR